MDLSGAEQEQTALREHANRVVPVEVSSLFGVDYRRAPAFRSGVIQDNDLPGLGIAGIDGDNSDTIAARTRQEKGTGIAHGAPGLGGKLAAPARLAIAAFEH